MTTTQRIRGFTVLVWLNAAFVAWWVAVIVITHWWWLAGLLILNACATYACVDARDALRR